MADLAVIPARGGSRRLPRKNVADFRGRPVLAWSVDAARASARFARIVVSTDDAAIADAAREAGAAVAERPAHLAGDDARVVDVCRQVLDAEEAGTGERFERLCCLYPTAPLRRAEDVAAVMDLLEPPRWRFAMAVTRYAHPPHQALLAGGDGALEPFWPELVERREAELGTLRVDNGSTYAAETAAFREHASFHGPGLRGHPMPLMRSIDIDEGEDLELARCIAGCLEP